MMKDMIDKRNERERIARSIIKYWNVNYIPRTQADSGKYGQEKDLDEVTKDQIDKILHEKAEHIHQLFENGGVE